MGFNNKEVVKNIFLAFQVYTDVFYTKICFLLMEQTSSQNETYSAHGIRLYYALNFFRESKIKHAIAPRTLSTALHHGYSNFL